MDKVPALQTERNEEATERVRELLEAESILETIRLNVRTVLAAPHTTELGTDKADDFRLFLMDLLGVYVTPAGFRRAIRMLHGREGNVIDFRVATASRSAFGVA